MAKTTHINDDKRKGCTHPASEVRGVVGKPHAQYCPQCYEIIPRKNNN